MLYLGPEAARAAVSAELDGNFNLVAVPSERAQVAAALPAADAVLDASMKVTLDETLIQSAKILKLVVTATTGADHIDQAALAARNIPLLTLKGQREILNELTPAAELSWLLLMACARRLRSAIKHVEAGEWDREQFPGILLKGKTLGIIGCGRIGQWMARYARAFGLRVVGHDPYLKDWPPTIERVALDDLLAQSNFVTIHVHLTPETRGLIGTHELALMPSGTILVNTSRGAIVEETALLDALNSRRLGAYGADVLEGEPEIEKSRIWQYAQTHPNCIITPHIGGFSPDAVEIVLRFSAQRIRQFFSSHGL